MEPAILWFERRIRRVKRLTKRQTLEALRQALKGRRLSSVSTNEQNSNIFSALSGHRCLQGVFGVSSRRQGRALCYSSKQQAASSKQQQQQR
jgi:hypothetical protein